MTTMQVSEFYKIARSVGLKRGEFSARSSKNKHGEYERMRINIFKSLREDQVREIAKHYSVTVFKIDGVIMWERPSISQEQASLVLLDLDQKDKHGLFIERSL